MAEESPFCDLGRGEDYRNIKEDAFKTGSQSRPKSGSQRDQHAQSSVKQKDATGGKDPRFQDIPPPPAPSRETSSEGGATGVKQNDDKGGQDQRPGDISPGRPPPPSRQTSTEGGAKGVKQNDDKGGQDQRPPARPPAPSRQTSTEGGTTCAQDSVHKGVTEKPPIPIAMQNSTGNGSTGTQGDGSGDSLQPKGSVTSLSGIKTEKGKPKPSDDNGNERIGSQSKKGQQDVSDNNGNTDSDTDKSETGTKSDVYASHGPTEIDNTEGESHDDQCPSPNTGPGNSDVKLTGRKSSAKAPESSEFQPGVAESTVPESAARPIEEKIPRRNTGRHLPNTPVTQGQCVDGTTKKNKNKNIRSEETASQSKLHMSGTSASNHVPPLSECMVKDQQDVITDGFLVVEKPEKNSEGMDELSDQFATGLNLNETNVDKDLDEETEQDDKKHKTSKKIETKKCMHKNDIDATNAKLKSDEEQINADNKHPNINSQADSNQNDQNDENSSDVSQHDITIEEQRVNASLKKENMTDSQTMGGNDIAGSNGNSSSYQDVHKNTNTKPKPDEDFNDLPELKNSDDTSGFKQTDMANKKKADEATCATPAPLTSPLQPEELRDKINLTDMPRSNPSCETFAGNTDHGSITDGNIFNGKYSIEKEGNTWCLKDVNTDTLYPQRRIKATTVVFEGKRLLLVDGVLYQIRISSKGKPKLEICEVSDSESSHSDSEHVKPIKEPREQEEQEETKPGTAEHVGSNATPSPQGDETDKPHADKATLSVSLCVSRMIQHQLFQNDFQKRFAGVQMNFKEKNKEISIMFQGDPGTAAEALAWVKAELYVSIQKIEFACIKRKNYVQNLPAAVDMIMSSVYGKDGPVFWEMHARTIEVCSHGQPTAEDVRAFLPTAIQVTKCKPTTGKAVKLKIEMLKKFLCKTFNVVDIRLEDSCFVVVNFEPHENQSAIEREVFKLLDCIVDKRFSLKLRSDVCSVDSFKNHLKASNELDISELNVSELAQPEAVWTFPTGQTVKLTVGSSESTGSSVVIQIVCMDEPGYVCNTATRTLRIGHDIVSELKKKSVDRKVLTREVEELFKLATATGVESICVCIPTGLENTLLLQTLWWCTGRLFDDNKSLQIGIFNCLNSESFDQCEKVMAECAKKGGNIQYHKTLPKQGASKGMLEVSVVTDGIHEVLAEVIVNSVRSDLNLEYGYVAREISKAAGNELQKSVHSKKKYLACWDFFETESYNMKNCRFIIHASVDPLKKPSEKPNLKNMKTLVTKCIIYADENRRSSIAFPALGTGKAGYSADDVAITMFEAIEDIREDLKYLKHIKLVIYEKDEKTLQVFLSEKDKWWANSYWDKTSSDTLTFQNVSSRAVFAPLNAIKVETIAYMYRKQLTETGYQDLCIFRSFEEKEKEMWLSDCRSKTKAGTIHQFIHPRFRCKQVAHIPCNDADTGLATEMGNAIKRAIKNKTHSLCIYIDRTLLKDNTGQKLCDVVAVLESTVQKPLQIVLGFGVEQHCVHIFSPFGIERDISMTVSGPLDDVLKFEKHLSSINGVVVNHAIVENTGASAGSVAEGSDKQTTIEDAGTKNGGLTLEHQGQGIIEKSAKMSGNQEIDGTRRKDNYSLHNKTSDVEPDQQTILRGLNGWTREMLKAGPESRIVIIERIPSGTSEKSLRELLNGFLKKNMQLLFMETVNEAHVLCDSDADARSLLKETQLKMKMKPYQGMFLQHYTYHIPKERLQKGFLLDFLMQKKFTKPYFTFTEDQTGNCNVTSLTLYGALYIKWSLERYEYKSYSNVSELKYEVLIAKYRSEILGVGKTDGDILFENGLIRLVCRKSCVGTVDKYIKTLLQFEGEKDFSIKTSDLEKAKELCKELVEDGYVSVVTNNEGPKLIVLFETYDEITKVTKRVQSIQGKDVKPTGRQRRHGAAADPLPHSNDLEPVKESSMSERKITCRPENLVKYSVGLFEIQVYKASICDLSVDCIVNAANERLSHGAGVARAIADRAGNDLTTEGNKYIRSNGPIGVGDVALTTAGLLPYKCVIHAVGPRWGDYDTNTPEGVQQCGKDLYKAVLNSFSMANEEGMKSVAIPAISSAIFGVPITYCTMKYARAVLDFCTLNKNNTCLREIHFVDVNEKTVEEIQKMFNHMILDSKPEPYHPSDFLPKSQSWRGHGGYMPADTSSTPKNQQQSFSASMRENDHHKLIAPLKHEKVNESEGVVIHKFQSRELGQNIICYTGNILDAKVDSLVVIIDTKGGLGQIGKGLKLRMDLSNEGMYESDLKGEIFKNSQTGSVIETGGYGTQFKNILHVVLPFTVKSKSPQERCEMMKGTYQMLYQKVCNNEMTRSVAMTLLAVDTDKPDEISLGAEMFWSGFLAHCQNIQRKENRNLLDLHLVCVKNYTLSKTTDLLVKGNELLEQGAKELLKVNEGNEVTPEELKEQDTCVICIEKINEPKKLSCGHIFCRDCIDQSLRFKQSCPTCGRVCGKITGDQPPGKMIVKQIHGCCTGYETDGKISIRYEFFDGRQLATHPLPGKMYFGISRTAYLPDNEQGRNICRMLKVAFERKLVFTIGNSRTTGQDGVITWNDIHHKTDFRPNSQFGYPDPTYLDRVTDELKAKGVTLDDINPTDKLEGTITTD